MKKDKKKTKSGGGGKTVDFGKHLRALNKHLDAAKEKAAESAGGYDEFDDGKYRARAVAAEIGVSQNKRVQVVITWKFLDGDYKGKEKKDFEGLAENHLPYLLRKLDAMGYDTTELEDLEGELKQILDDIKKSKPKCKIRLKTKGDFQNVYVDGVLDAEEEEADEDDEEAEEESPKKKSKKSKKDDDDEEDDADEDDADEEEGESDADDDDTEDEDEEEEDEEDEEDKPKVKKGKSKKSDDDEEDDEEDEDEEDDEEEEVEDEVDVVVGSKVTADSKKEGKIKGKVVELFEAEGKVLIKTDKGKSLKLSVDKILTVEESPASSVPSKKKSKK